MNRPSDVTLELIEKWKSGYSRLGLSCMPLEIYMAIEWMQMHLLALKVSIYDLHKVHYCVSKEFKFYKVTNPWPRAMQAINSVRFDCFQSPYEANFECFMFQFGGNIHVAQIYMSKTVKDLSEKDLRIEEELRRKV